MASRKMDNLRLESFVRRLDGLTLMADRVRLPEAFVLLVAVAFNGFNAWRFSLPVGYAGLFSMMTEEVLAHRFLLPRTIPFYGPGGIPFAYPPLGPYVAAAFTGILHVPLMTYLRFAPPAFTVLALVGAYFMASRVLGDRYKGLVTAALLGTLALEYDYHATASGMVRGLALAFLMAGLGFAWDALHAPGRVRWKVVLAGAALGLTTLTHLSYAVVFLISLLIFTFTQNQGELRLRLTRTATILLVSLVPILPWMIATTSIHGVGVYQAALTTHGNLGVVRSLLWYRNLFLSTLWWTISGIGASWTSIPLVGLFLAGLAYAWMRRRWLLPLWFLTLILLTGEPDRFLMVVACLLVADLGVDLAKSSASEGAAHPLWAVWRLAVPAAIVYAYCFLAGFRIIRSQEPQLSVEAVSMGTWMQSSTPAASTIYYTSTGSDLAEWMPYLTRRTPVIEPWGAEWIGTYDEQSRKLGKLASCGGGFECLMQMLDRLDLHPDYMIVGLDRAKIIDGLSADPHWRQVFENQGFRVFQRTS